MGDEDRAFDIVSDAGDVRQEYDWESTRPSMAVVKAVAATTGERPTGLDTLNDVVDADALDTLLRDSEGEKTVRVGFEYHGTSVVLRGNGTVSVRLD
jgi:hypothetical protein